MAIDHHNHHNLCFGCMEEKGEQSVCPACGFSAGTGPESLLHLPPGTVLQGKYLIGRALGQGGFGITYLAWDLTLNLKLAIKEYMPQYLATRTGPEHKVTVYKAALKEEFNYGLTRFLEEARTLARFNEHPNIVTVRDYFEANNTAYLIMNYNQGITLQTYLKRQGGKITSARAVELFMPVLDALKEVHAAGILHRDISPDNILISEKGRVILIDFGAARQAVTEHSKSMSVIMKAGYSPIEQYQSKGKQGPWTDIYAVAASFYQVITGQLPPESLDRLADDTLVSPSSLGINIPVNQEFALSKALTVRAKDRYLSVTEFQKALSEPIYHKEQAKQMNSKQDYYRAEDTLPGSKNEWLPDEVEKTISAGDLHSLVIVRDSVYSFGRGKNGQLGHNKDNSCKIPKKIKNISAAKSVSAGSLHTLVLLQNYEVLSCGHGECGRLGHGNKRNYRKPARIGNHYFISKISAGWRHSLMLSREGKVLSFGWGITGQLGVSSLTDNYYPQTIPGFNKVKAISAGNLHSLILLDNGQVYSFGSGEYGQLGHGDSKDVYYPKKIEALSNAVAISAGGYHSLVLLSNGDVYAFGCGEYGRLGSIDREDHSIPIKVNGVSRVKSISAGGLHSLLLTENGDIYSFGYGGYGQLGCGEIKNSYFPTKIDSINNIAEISAGYLHSLVKLVNGSVYSFGCGSDGRLGHGDEVNYLEPKLITAGSDFVAKRA